jgi:hypothetical protein
MAVATGDVRSQDIYVWSRTSSGRKSVCLSRYHQTATHSCKEEWTQPWTIRVIAGSLLYTTTGCADSKTWQARSPDVCLIVFSSKQDFFAVSVSRLVLVSVGVIKMQRTSLSGLYCSLFFMLKWVRPAKTNRIDVHIKWYCQIQPFSV